MRYFASFILAFVTLAMLADIADAGLFRRRARGGCAAKVVRGCSHCNR